LTQNARNQSERQFGQVAAARRANERSENRDDDRDRDEASEYSVHKLDHGVQLEVGNELVLFAGWPVRAAESRLGEANCGAGHNDDAKRNEGHARDLAIARRRHGSSLPLAGRDCSVDGPVFRHADDGERLTQTAKCEELFEGLVESFCQRNLGLVGLPLFHGNIEGEHCGTGE